ncbi:LOW QUALITY PROTEIN: disrupted in schizophrenia 1 protein [Mauremys reevesii]|uniref:LOW QUALITY PROTEIN: disrupted in schizophrenia 1 protein n=1 Tax=Mauremys reevesii TaxID=260615 RepID=UPI00193FFBB5|nr:LOW QUALITY PROTEIN: disrupted in schizophrenia 1 protein [Mauremys reevesii]
MWGGAGGERRQQPQPQPQPQPGRGGLSPDGQDHSLPPVSYHKKKLAKRPGYMRPQAPQQIKFQPPAHCKPFNPKGLDHGRKHCEDFKNCSLHRLCKNDFEFLHCNSSVNSTIVTTTVVTTSTTAGNMTGSLRNLSDLRIQPSENVILPVCPAAATCKRDFSPVCSSNTWQTNLLATTWETIHGARVKEPKKMYTLDQKEVNNNCVYNKEVTSYSSSTWDSFNSSFSFIQLSLNSSFEKSDTEGQSDGKATEHTLETNATGQIENVNLHEPGERLRSSHKDVGASSCICRHGEDYQCARETIVKDKLQDCEMVSLLDTDAAFSCSTDSSDAASAGSSVTSGYESSFTVSDHNWDTLMRKYEPVLLDCLVGNRSTLKIKSLMLRLQRLQEKAIEEDDYDKADKFRRKLEELEREKNSLKFQLPSKHPSIISFLDRFSAQVQTALYWAGDRVGSEEAQLWQKNEQTLLSPAYQKTIQVSTTKRNQLLQEKQWLQKEIEDLRARLAVLEAKDQQLRGDIEEQDRLIQLQDCELTALLSCVSLRELQEISKALEDTLASSYQIPFSLDLPETIKSLQEKEQSLSMSIKETTAKVCASQKLCSTLRRKVSDIETQLPALLEAKMLAVSGSNFCTAKDLAEEIRSLTSEREGLEGLLNELLVLNTRNVRKLERIKEDYNRLKQELEQGESAFETNVKEDAVKFMEMLEDKLHSCGNQLLERVWEADLEACQLLIQGFQLKEAGCCVSEGEEGRTDEMDAADDHCSDTARGKESHFPKGTERGAVSCPTAQTKCRELKEDCHLFSAELGEKCEAISEKLVQLEDQLQTSVCSLDDGFIQSLQREIQMVKETLQAMLMQLQTDKEAGEDEAGTSSVTAGVQEKKT